MPLRPVSRSAWKNSAKTSPGAFHDVRQELPAEALFLGSPPLGEVEEDLIEQVEIDAGRVPDGIEITRFHFGRHEAAIDLDPRTSSFSQQGQCLGQSVQQVSSASIPSKAVNYLVPVGRVLSGW